MKIAKIHSKTISKIILIANIFEKNIGNRSECYGLKNSILGEKKFQKSIKDSIFYKINE